jgi:hypothetical protein
MHILQQHWSTAMADASTPAALNADGLLDINLLVASSVIETSQQLIHLLTWHFKCQLVHYMLTQSMRSVAAVAAYLTPGHTSCQGALRSHFLTYTEMYVDC